jgi:hypothetical protein
VHLRARGVKDNDLSAELSIVIDPTFGALQTGNDSQVSAAAAAAYTQKLAALWTDVFGGK